MLKHCWVFFFVELTHPCEQPEHKFMYLPAQPVPDMIHDSDMLHVEALPRCCNTHCLLRNVTELRSQDGDFGNGKSGYRFLVL